VTGFTKYFYADLAGCDLRKLCFAIHARMKASNTKAKKPLLMWYGKKEKVDYAHIVRLSLLLFRIYFDTLINLHGDIIKTDTPRFEITSTFCLKIN
jgi:predicted ATP-grasp superfamily ATP-dependent carboligase